MGSDNDVRRVDANNYAQPVIEPTGGFTIERSLVYAIARKETGFNARARSGAGAYGLDAAAPLVGRLAAVGEDGIVFYGEQSHAV